MFRSGVKINCEGRRDFEASVVNRKATTGFLSCSTRVNWVQSGLCDLMIKSKLHVLCINCKPLILCCNRHTVQFVSIGSLAVGR